MRNARKLCLKKTFQRSSGVYLKFLISLQSFQRIIGIHVQKFVSRKVKLIFTTFSENHKNKKIIIKVRKRKLETNN